MAGKSTVCNQYKRITMLAEDLMKQALREPDVKPGINRNLGNAGSTRKNA